VKSSRSSMRPILWAMTTVVAMIVPLAAVSAPASSGAEASAAPRAVPGRYIVMTKGAPLASYRGGVGTFPRTRPTTGHKLNVRTPAAKKYRSFLVSSHKAVLAKAGLPANARLHDYSVVFNGFAAKLTPAQAARLKHTSGVLHVWKDELRTTDTISTPHFLGLDGASGVWQQQFGGNANAGRGMIIADLDSGIWPENPSFAPLASTPDQAIIDEKWNGICDPGVVQPIACNNKLIGARYYGASFGNNISLDFNSPRDRNGHGSHTASTAGGNNNVPVIINGANFGAASGMAPAARIAAYKVLWQTAAGTASGTTIGIVQAINDAVADGADVINYSISGSSTSIVSPDEMAFLGAADAGVFVATSAGNSGDTVGVSSVAHNAPWEMTVAASTHDRGAAKTVTLGNGASYPGVGYGPAVASSPIIDSSLAGPGAPGGPNDPSTLCFSSTWPGGPGLDPAKVAGKIVMCTRGINDRVDKSKAVKDAGGVGMVLIDANAAQSPTADFHAVPSIHVNFANGQLVKAYVDAPGSPTASISATDSSPIEAPTMAGFSSFGPALAGGGDLLKPDITAPGVSVIAAVSPAAAGMNFNSLDGTSMSTPHITGIAAMILQKHPTWSPMWVKSAMMTGATTLTNVGNPIKRGAGNATPLDYGSGHVVPAKSFDPGLVYDSTKIDWFRYACGIGQLQLLNGGAAACAAVGSIDPSDLNYPSIAVSGMAGSQTITRTFTNTSVDQGSQYKPTIVAPPGTTVTVNDDKISVPPQQSRSYKLTITRTSATLNAWTFGSITWTDKRGHSVRSPIAVRPVAAAVPTAVTGNGTSGTRAVSVQPGYTGTLNTVVAGLAKARVDTVPGTKGQAPNTATVNIPVGTTVARFATYDADYPAGTDIDLEVRRGGTLVGTSGGATAEEAVNFNNPVPGDYVVTVVYFDGATPSLDMKLNSFAVPATAAGNLTANPASQPVTTGVPVTVNLNWSGLDAGFRYLGTVTYNDGTATLGRTVVNILP
jgi:hypothetical protein